MRTVVVQLPGRSDQGMANLLELAPGEEVTFGRGTEDSAVGIPLPDPGVSRLAGRICATGDYWLVSNLSRSTTYIVENPEGAGEFIKVAPRRLDMPVPFELARVVLPADKGWATFMVFAPEHAYADAELLERRGGEQTVATFPLDETAKYFLVLVALCEPRLKDSSTVAIPSAPEIVARLRGLKSCQAMTRVAVNFHIDYLARVKLRVKEPAEAAEAAKADWQRAALVSLALRFNLVREEHLKLLPGRPLGQRPAAMPD
jgi:hypothetical protein